MVSKVHGGGEAKGCIVLSEMVEEASRLRK